MRDKIPPFLLRSQSSAPPVLEGRGMKMPFIEKGIDHLSDIIKSGYIQWELASREGFFQKLDARIKVIFLLFFIFIVSLKKNVMPEVGIGIFIFALALLSRLNIVMLYKRVFFWGFFFGFLVAFPSAFNIITRGEIIMPVINLSKPHTFWIYHIPQEIGLTKEGLYSVVMLTMRVVNSLSISFLVLYTTPFHEIIKALKILRVPDAFLMIITLSYKYIFLFAKTVGDMHIAKKSRLVRGVSNAQAREWIAGRIAFIFRKTRMRCEDVFNAMLSRGLSDKIKFYGYRKIQVLDWSAGISLLLIGILFLMI
jgi:cobalt ECF transporter T component CbiQ